MKGARGPAAIACAAGALLAAEVSAQTVEVRGRVVERGGEAGIAGAEVSLGERTVLTDLEGRFVLRPASGSYTLRVTSFGYADHESRLAVRGDTSIVVALDPAPVALDTLVVEGRTVTIRGEVRDEVLDMGLHDVEVIAGDREEHTNVIGEFKVDDVPAGPPFRLSIREFGYLPVETIVSVFEDTTFVFNLRPDPIMQQMIARQVGRLEGRAKPHVTAVMPPMNRDYLMHNRNATALDLIRYRYGQFVNRVQCILIDDRQSYNGLGELSLYLPDELERIEVLERGKMLRVYTRDFIRNMIGGAVRTLPDPVYVPVPRGAPFCR